MGSNASKSSRRPSASSTISGRKYSCLSSEPDMFDSSTQRGLDTDIVFTENQCCGLSDEEVQLFFHPRPFPHSSIRQDTFDNIPPLSNSVHSNIKEQLFHPRPFPQSSISEDTSDSIPPSSISSYQNVREQHFYPRPFPSSSLPPDITGLPDLLDNLSELEVSTTECSNSFRSQTPSTLSCISHLTESTDTLDAATTTPLSETASDSESIFGFQPMSHSSRFSCTNGEWSERVPLPPPLPPTLVPPPPPPPPPLNCLSSNFSKNTHLFRDLAKTYQALPVPKTKMKKFNWSKVSTGSIDQSFWQEQQTGCDLSDIVDYEDLERKFSQQSTGRALNQRTSSVDGRKVKLAQNPPSVQLLDSRRSLSVGVALKQLRLDTPLIVETLRKGRRGSLTVEQLRALKRIMPEPSEMERLRNYNGNFDLLGVAEKYYLLISDLPAYQLRVELMLQELELESTIETISTQLSVIVRTGGDILSSESLRNFLRLILQIGNYLNAGSYAGNAVGFRLSSLSKLVETRANSSTGLTLLHYVVQLAGREREPLLQFVEEFTSLRNAARVSMETVVADIATLTETFNQLKSSLQHAPVDLRLKSKEFVCNAERCVNELTQQLTDVKRLQWRLIRHFGEDEATFSIEQCMTILANLVDQIKRAQKENCSRREEQQRSQHRAKPKAINHDRISSSDYGKLRPQRSSVDSGWMSPSSSSGPEDALTESVLGWRRKPGNGRTASERAHSRRRRVRRTETLYLPVRERSPLNYH